jgi:adenylate kinase
MVKQRIVILYGPPGAGKDTQAERIAHKFNFVIVSSSKLIEERIFNPALQNDSIIQRERKLFEAGRLCTPSWITEIINEKVNQLHQEGKGLIFTGSPRTLYEAENEIPYWESIFGQNNILAIVINIRPETSIFRNSHRRICEKCHNPIIFSKETENLTQCPVCGGKIIDRGVLDAPETIKVRLQEYKNRTEPIFKYLKERGYQLIGIDGEPLPDEVTKQIFKKLEPLIKND